MAPSTSATTNGYGNGYQNGTSRDASAQAPLPRMTLDDIRKVRKSYTKINLGVAATDDFYKFKGGDEWQGHKPRANKDWSGEYDSYFLKQNLLE